MQPQDQPTPTPPQDPQGFYNPQQQPPANNYAEAPQPEAEQQAFTSAEPVAWEASEYIHHDKGSLWVLILIIVTLALAGVAFWFKQWTFMALILVMAAAMGFFAFRPPRTQHYVLTDAGIKIGDRFYDYTDFSAFGVMQEGAFFTMMLIPTKRFMPSISVYFAEKDGDKIVDTIGSHLPMKDIKPDTLDRIMQRLRF